MERGFPKHPPAALSDALFGFLLLVLFFILFFGGCQRRPDPEKPVAVVGDDAIKYGEFRAALKDIVPEKEKDVSPEEEAELRKNLLNQMIEERLFLRAGEKANIGVTDGEVLDEINALKENIAPEELEAWIQERYGSSENWKEEVGKKLLVKKTIENLVDSKVAVTEKEAMDYYMKTKAFFEAPERVRIRMIVVDTEEKAREAQIRLKKERFEDVAKSMSMGPEAQEGGDLGFSGRGEMPPEFEEAVFGMAQGKTSAVVKTPYGYHIFKVEQRKPARKLPFKEAKDEIMETLFREKSEKKYRELAIGLKSAVKIEVDEELLLR